MPELVAGHQGCVYDEPDSGALSQTPSLAFALRVPAEILILPRRVGLLLRFLCGVKRQINRE